MTTARLSALFQELKQELDVEFTTDPKIADKRLNEAKEECKKIKKLVRYKPMETIIEEPLAPQTPTLR